MLTDTYGKNSVIIREFVDLADYRLRNDFSLFRFEFQGELFFPVVQLFYPRFDIFLGLHIAVDNFQRLFDIALNGNIYQNIFIDFCWVDINMDDLCIFTKFCQFAGYPVIKTYSCGDNQIRMVDSNIGVNRPMHSQHAQRKRIVGREYSQTHCRSGDGDAGFLYQGSQFL